MADIRDELFREQMGQQITAAVTAERAGILAGSTRAQQEAKRLGLEILYFLEDGSAVGKGEKVLLVRGNPKQIALAEEVLMGNMSKASGIATAAHRAVAAAGGSVSIVSGAWKKMPPSIKEVVREAVALGGAQYRMAQPPFLYLDKNYVRIFGGVTETLTAAKRMGEYTTVIQLKSDSEQIANDAETAVRMGASVVMIDTGREQDVTLVSERLKATGLRSQVGIAFAKGIEIEDIPSLAYLDVDALDIGAAIVDAPLLDMRLDIVKTGPDTADAMDGEADLFEKTELWLEDIVLRGADLSEIATVVAETLKLDRREVLVIDVQPSWITLDLLRKRVKLGDMAGKEGELLERLSHLNGVTLGEHCGIHSEGILGIIALPPEQAGETLRRAQQIGSKMQAEIARRVKIYPTGSELLTGGIVDTNSPLIKKILEDHGYHVAIAEPLPDSVMETTSGLMRGVDEGYGLVMTTGGTGAEGKDCTIEAVLAADPTAATPWVMKFQKGTGRHLKEGVRIAVGVVDGTWLIALPGPNDEVRAAMELLPTLLEQRKSKEIVAEAIADRLRTVVREKSHLYHHCH